MTMGRRPVARGKWQFTEIVRTSDGSEDQAADAQNDRQADQEDDGDDPENDFHSRFPFFINAGIRRSLGL